MFFFPISTDAPVYYWPFATVLLIAVNIAVFFAMITGAISSPVEWILWYGNGLHATQWLTSIFVHASVDHLLGNMLFLWVFGLVVEGKLGWQKFLACYLSIGVGESMIEQVAMLGYSGEVPGSLGASAAIFGLMAMATVWAPKNEITFFFWVFIRAGTFDVSILALATAYVSLELVFLILSAGTAGSSWLHLAGVALGLPLGIALLKRGIVECEGWDLFHVWRGDYGGFKEEPDPREVLAESAEREQSQQQRIAIDAKQQVRTYLENGNLQAALVLCHKMRVAGRQLTLDRDELFAIIHGLHQQRNWAESAPYMAEFIDRFPDGADPVRVKLAQICVVELERPGKALDLLADVDAAQLSAPQAELAKRVSAKAQAMRDEGIVEFDTDAW